MERDSGGTKHDGEKIQLDLLSPRWVVGVGSVLTFGAKKYAAHNWRKGIALSRLLGACLRHVFAFIGGEDRDAESGLSHLYHASCCLMFASELHETRPDLDDRYKGEPKPEYYWTDGPGKTVYTEQDPEVTCPHCKRTFRCDAMDAACRLCGKRFT